MEGPDEPDIELQLAEYLKDIHYKHYCANEHASPIPYWLSKRSIWPQLTALALDLYSIPIMSNEPERVFSTTGAAVTPRRRSLLDSTIGHLMVTKQWLKTGLIQLSRYAFTSTAATKLIDQSGATSRALKDVPCHLRAPPRPPDHVRSQ